MILSNHCHYISVAGIELRDGAYALIRDNYYYKNASTGIGLQMGASAVINGNECEGNQAVGIGRREGFLLGNAISRSGAMPPLVMIFEGSHADLTENPLTREGEASICCAGSVLINGHEIKPDTSSHGLRGSSSAIWVLPEAEVVLHRNEFSGWRKPLLASAAKVIASQNRDFAINAKPVQTDQFVFSFRADNNNMVTLFNQ